MSLTGTIEDVPLADVIQMLSLARRSGSLRVRHGSASTEVGFSDGKIVSATCPSARKPEELLVQLGILGSGLLAEARSLQRQSAEPTTVDSILVDRGFARQETIDRATEQCITEVIEELLSLQRGSYEFANDDPQSSSSPAPRLYLDTQRVLMQATERAERNNRVTGEILRFEANRGASAGEPAPVSDRSDDYRPAATAATPQNGTGQAGNTAEQIWIAEKSGTVHTRLEVVTRDRRFLSELETFLGENTEVVHAKFKESLEYLRTDVAPIVLLDLRDGSLTQQDITALGARRPSVPILAVTDSDAAQWSHFQAGALSVLPADPAVVRSCVQTISRSLAPRLTRRSINLRSKSIRTLRDSLAELRSSQVFGTVTLNLLRVLSNFVDRAVFFLVRRSELELEVLGAFGSNDRGELLAEVMRGLRIPLREDSPLSNAALDGLVRVASVEEDPFHREFLSLLGNPRDPQATILPVYGANRIMAVVYTDNGETTNETSNIEILELAAVQFGIALENEFLRRRIG